MTLSKRVWPSRRQATVCRSTWAARFISGSIRGLPTQWFGRWVGTVWILSCETSRSPDAWVTVPAAAPKLSVAAAPLGILIGDKTVEIDLTGDPVAELKEKVYRRRIAATTLMDLTINDMLPGIFVTYLNHTREFTLPLAIGDCYREMGEFETALRWYQKARDYEYLNQPIESPVVWLNMAKCLLAWGNFLYKRQDKEGDKLRYGQIIPNPEAASPLYVEPVFLDMKKAVEAILAAGDDLDVDVHNPAIAQVVLLARLNLQNIAAGIDFPLLSLAREEAPVFTFEYLQNVARYFAEHAIQAERAYISFKTSAEQEQFQRSMLQNAVDLEEMNEVLEDKKLEIARQQRAAVNANWQYADLQAKNAKTLYDEYKTVSLAQNARWIQRLPMSALQTLFMTSPVTVGTASRTASIGPTRFCTRLLRREGTSPAVSS